MKVQCSRCSEEHDLEHMDPSYALPDVVFALPIEERRRRSRASKDLCLLESPGEPKRLFVRVLLQFLVAARLRPCRWGIWVEVSRATFNQVVDLWNNDQRTELQPVLATVANELPGYSGSLGLRGSLRFINLTDIPYFTLEGDHPLAQDQRDGVSTERAVDWLLSIAHG